MAYEIEQNLTRVNSGEAGHNTPEWIIWHFVGASGQARGNARYFKNTYRGASAHYFIDPNIITQVVDDDTPAWHIGDGKRTRQGTHNGYVKAGYATNTNAIGLELCQDTSTGSNAWEWDFHTDTVEKAEWLTRKLQKQYNIDDDHVIRHFDASTKPCPGNWKPNNWRKWWEMKKRLKYDGTPTNAQGNNNPEGKHDDEHMHLVQEGETLYSIARSHGVTVDQMIAWNDLEDKDLILPESKLFVKPPNQKPPQTSIEELAKEVIDGKHGSGETRRKRLGNRYEAVQKAVNDILLGRVSKPRKTTDQLAKEVMDGKHGSGDSRKSSLGSRYDEVQRRVNQLLGNSGGSGKSINQLAEEVIRGQHGSGRDRKRSLGSDYAAVQKEVNRIINGK